jgi:hypothetical protein
MNTCESFLIEQILNLGSILGEGSISCEVKGLI